MSVTLTNGTGGLFDILGVTFGAHADINAGALGAVPTAIEALLTKCEGISSPSLAVRDAPGGIPSSTIAWQGASIGLSQALQAFAQTYLVETFDADAPLPAKTVEQALKALVKQMIGAGSVASPDTTIAASTPAASLSVYAGNTGTGTMVLSTKRGDGLQAENALAEDIVFRCTQGGAGAVFSMAGEQGITALSYDWPRGSGAVGSIGAWTAGGVLLNGGFDDQDDRAGTPDDWIISTGTIGTTIKMTTLEVQTVAISGTPTSGYYVLVYTNLSSKVQTTAPIAYNATAATVQAALRLLIGLEQVTVTSTGTTPNYTHTITFIGAGGNQSQLTSATTFDTGSIAHGTTTAGSANVYGDSYALEFDADGSQLTEIRQVIGVEAYGQYAFGGLFKVDSVPAAGVLTVDLWDGSAVISDDAGTANSFTIDATALTTSFAWKTGSFRLPRALPNLVYLRIRISTAVSNTTSVFIDECRLVPMQECYAGGPSVALFTGATAFIPGDRITVVVTNDRAGQFQEYFERFFSMRELGMQLPSTTGAEAISDALIT